MMKNHVRKIFAIAFTTTFICLTLSGLSLAADTIKIAVAGAHTGDLASYGIPHVKAAELVVKKVNAQGGVLGKPVELIIQDDACKPELATNAATKVVGDGAHFVIGHTCSGATKAALGIYKESKTICISPSATNTELTLSGDYPNFYRTIAYDDAQAQLQVNFAVNILKVKTVACLHDKGDYGKGQSELAKKYFEAAGIEVVLFEGVTPNAVDYSAIVQKIKRNKPDLVLWGGYHPEASKIVGTMRRKKMKTLFLGADGIKDDTFIKVAGVYGEGVYATGPKDVSKNEMTSIANDEHKQAYGEDPGPFFIEAYSATLAILNAIEKAGSTDYDAVSAALKSEYVDTPLGKIKFDDKGDAMGVGFSTYRVQNGVYKEL